MCQQSNMKFKNSKIQKFENSKLKKKKMIDRQHKEMGAIDEDQHKYYSSLCRHPKCS